uniref:CWH43-like N-terminal domain-containing protein n=1 Tax=Wuchereria bancrofti TaxID=6293 RepID=A0AAF5PSV1_WUCBA
MHFTTINLNENGKVNGWKKESDEMKFNEESIVSYHQKDDNKEDYIILLEISFQNYALVTVGAPVLALIIDFLLGFSLDYQQILAYDWACGPVNIPSFSRIINLPKERIIWNAAVLFHLPLRFLLVLTNYRICRIPSNEVYNQKVHEALSQIIILSGLVEILMVLLLTVIGEREETHQLHGTHFNWHVYFFMTFALSSAVHFAVITATYRKSKHYVEHFNGHWGFKLKFYLTLVYIALLPVTFIFFAMYWMLCYNFAYDFFALSEYLLILVNYAFHASVIYDCDDIYQFKMPKHWKNA